jgi:Long-chain acyl-CoA synthetases (AMP-forming)
MNNHVYTDLLRESIKKNASRPCFHIKRDGNYQTWLYADFHRDLNRMVDALKKHGFSGPDNGVVIGENTPEWAIAYHAFFLAGGRTVPIDPNLPAAEIREIIRLTEARFIVCSPPFVGLFRDLKSDFPFIKKLIVIGNSARGDTPSFKDFCDSGDADIDAFAGAFAPDDPLVIIFTSGTTGRAKGVMLIQRNFTATPVHAVPRMKVDANDTMLAVLPLHHVFGAAACFAAALCTGMDVVFVPKIKGPLILEALNERRVTILPAVPKMIALFHSSIEHALQSKGFAVRALFAFLSLMSASLGPLLGTKFRKKIFASIHKKFGGRLNLIISGGASLQKKYFSSFRLWGFTIVEGYGLTETFGPITLCPGDDPRLGSVGTVLPDNEMKICSPDPSGVGEVLFKGETVFTRYYNNEEQTRGAFDPEGWFHTGDLGRTDKDGFLYLSGRIKDVIVLDSGKNAYPDELEDYYLTSQLIEEIGVFGANVKGKEIIAALIVPSPIIRRAHPVPKASEIIHNEVSRMGRNLPSYKKITDFAVVYEPLPKTTTIKLKKQELRQMYYALRNTSGARAVFSHPVSAIDAALIATGEYTTLVKRIIAAAGPLDQDQVLPAHNLELDLGLDSLKRLDVLCSIEETYSVVFPDDALVSLQTVGDLYALTMELRSSAADQTGISPAGFRQRLATAAFPAPAASHASLLSESIPRLAFSISKLLWNVSVKGLETLPIKGPFIFCANHQSYLDGLLLLHALPRRVRETTVTTGKSEVLKSPVLSPFINRSSFIPVERDGDVVQALKLSIAALKNGKNLILFPEGGRSRTGEMRPFKSGVGLLMLETNAAVVPAKIKGTFDVWPAGKFPKLIGARRHALSITFGPPLNLQDMIDMKKITPYSTAQMIAACIHNIIQEM